MNINKSIPESFKSKINLNSLSGYYPGSSNIYIPLISVEYEYKTAYNDKIYDPVWSGTAEGKSSISDFNKNSARINLLSTSIVQRFTGRFSIDAFYSAQYIDNKIYAKTDLKKISPPLTKEWSIKLNYDPTNLPYGFRSHGYLGFSSYWDPAISMQRDDHDKGNRLYGWIAGYEFDLKYLGGELKIVKNYSADIKTLIEAADKYTYEFSFFVRI